MKINISIILLFSFVVFFMISPSFGDYNENEYRSNFDKGFSALFYEKNYENASLYFTKCLSINDGDCRKIYLYYLLGLTNYNLGDLNTSLYYYHKSESLILQNNCSVDPFLNPTLNMEIGRDYLFQGDYVKSEIYLKKANEQKDYLNTESKLILSLLVGEIYIDSGKYEEALSTYETIKSENLAHDELLIQELDERIKILEQLNYTDAYFKEDTIIYPSNNKVHSKTTFNTNLDILLSYIYYFNSAPPEIPEYVEYTNDSVFLGFYYQLSQNKTNQIEANVTDSDIIVYSSPFPNFVLTIESPYFYGDNKQLVASFNSKPLYIDTYTKTIKIYDLDRYLSISSFFGSPIVSYEQNCTIIQWNYSSILTPKALIGVPYQNKSSFDLFSTGEILVLLKPESQKHWSQEKIIISKPLKPENPPVNFAVYRHDTRFPKNSDTIIPLLLNTKSNVFIDYVKVGKKEYSGPIEWKEDITIENETYYTLESLENTTLVLLKSTSSGLVDVELKYHLDSSKYVTQIDDYSWNYNITYFYQVGDIADNTQTYVYVLPEGYTFQNYPKESTHSINEDNLEQIILVYKVGERERAINFTIERIHEKPIDKITTSLKNFIGVILENLVWLLFSAFIYKFKRIKELYKKYISNK